jgi:hypothetical protein
VRSRSARHQTTGFQIGPADDVLEAVLGAGDHVVAQVDRHDRLAEGRAVVGHVRQLGDRELPAARDPMQVGVADPEDARALRDEIVQTAIGHVSILS